MKNKIKLSNLTNFIKFNGDPEAILERKQFSSNILLDPSDEQTFLTTISTADIDREGDIVLPEGCNTQEFEQNSVVLWNHSYSSPPIGKVVALQVLKDKVVAKIKLANTPFANELWSLISGGFLRASSIGFVIDEYLVAGTEAFKHFVMEYGIKITSECKRIITKWRLLENSLVPLPCNQNALVLAVSNKALKIDQKLLKELGIETQNIADPADPIQEVNLNSNIANVSVPESEKEAIPATPELVKAPEVLKEPIWTIIRNSEYILTPEDLQITKMLQKGKIL